MLRDFFVIDETVMPMAEQHQIGNVLRQLFRSDLVTARPSGLVRDDVRDQAGVDLLRGQIVAPEHLVLARVLTTSTCSRPQRDDGLVRDLG
jgi:hypothetical protein